MEAFWVSTQLCHNRARSNQIVYAICLIGAAYSVFGIANHYFEPNWILFDSKFYYLDSVTSTFVNRNSFATYAGIALVANLSVLFAAFRHVSERNIHPFIRIIAAITGLPGIWLSMSFLVGISLVMTGSRGGVLSFIFGAIAIGIIGLLRKKGHVSSSIWILVMASLMLSTVAFYFSGFLESRFLVHGLESSDRVAVYRLTLISIRDEPWLGFGYGTFQYVFPWYLDSTIAAGDFWDRAHNTYLEVFQGLGIPVATIYLLSLGALALRCARGAVRRHAFATAPTVAAGATVIVATHSLVDFSMQVQSIALTWSLLLGAGVAQSWNRSNTKNSSENGSKSNQR